MLQQMIEEKPHVRIGDMAAMLRLMGPLHGPIPDPVESRRRLLADLCRFIGVKIGMLPPGALAEMIGAPEIPPPPAGTATVAEPSTIELSPRLSQTLQLLLQGDSEKQVAIKLKLSRNTVHSYVKAIYRRYEVQTRAELLARYFKR
jgi:DNA-binding CsgD family transcriptional regulator